MSEASKPSIRKSFVDNAYGIFGMHKLGTDGFLGVEQGSSGRDGGTQTPAGNEDVLDLVGTQSV